MSQLQLFDYAGLSPELQVEVRSATERIKLRMKRTVEDIIEIGKDLIAIKEKLPHGQFLPWIATEFEMSLMTANRFMNVAERFGKSNIMLDFNPTTLYELAAPSTPDEVVEQAIEKVENGESVTVKEVKELKARLQSTEAEKASLSRKVSEQSSLIEATKQKLQEKTDLLTAADSLLKDEAERLAEQKAQKLKAEFEAQLQALQSEKSKAEEASQKAKSDYESALSSFKSNPDPETKATKERLEREAKKAQSELDTTVAELKRLQLQLEDLKTKENHAIGVSLTLCAFHKAFKDFMANNADAIVAMSSPYLDGRQQAEIEALAATLSDWAERIRDSVDSLRSQGSRAVDVEVVQPIRYFPEPYDEDDF